MALDKAKKDTGEITTWGKYAIFLEANNIKKKAKKEINSIRMDIKIKTEKERNDIGLSVKSNITDIGFLIKNNMLIGMKLFSRKKKIFTEGKIKNRREREILGKFVYIRKVILWIDI